MNYIGSILITSAASGLICAFMPDSSNISKYIKFITALVMVSIILMPVIEIVSDTDSLFDIMSEKIAEISKPNDNIIIPESGKWIVNESVNNIADSLKTMLSRKFDIAEENILIEVIVDDSDISEITVEKIKVTLAGTAVWKDSYEIENYIRDMLECDTEIIRKDSLR